MNASETAEEIMQKFTDLHGDQFNNLTMAIAQAIESERARLRIAVEALKKIADQDFRANRPSECVMAEQAIAKIGDV